MTNLRLVTPWVAAAALLVGLGSDPGAEDRVPVCDDPVTRIESALPVSRQGKMGDAPEAPGLPQGDAGPIRLGVLAAVAGLWSTGRGLSTCSARVITRTQENAP